MTEERKVQLGVSVDATEAKQGLNDIKTSAQSMAQSVAQAGAQAGKAVDGIGNGGASSASKVDAATKSMIQSIQRTTAVMEAGSKTSAKYFETLASQRGVDVNALRPYLDQLDALNAKQKDVGISAGQTANALRMVPAQLTDIVTSLASGQQPLTVLIQQGGQLKDSFGGIGPAARAMGGYIAGMINPLTLAAAAGAALAVAFVEGSKEAQAYNRALILTGNAAGTSATQLTDMAARISSISGTQRQAAGALAVMAETGRVAGASLEYFSRVALQMEKTVGQAVSETSKEFADLGKAPVEASERLNEKYRYLTSSIYEQISALQEQGRTLEAGAMAQKAYADAMSGRTNDLKDNLGVIEKAWGGITSVAKGAWDAMLGVGRKRTLSDQLADVTAEIAKAQKPFDPSVGGNAEARAKLQANLQLQASLQELIRLEQKQGAAMAANNALNEARIKWIKDGDQFQSRAAKMEQEITKARNEGAAAGASQVEIEKRIADIREKYKEKSTAAANTEVATLKARIQGEQQYLAQLKLNGAEADKLNQGEKDALKYSQMLKGTLDAKTRARTEELLIQAKISAGILKEIESTKELIKAQEDFRILRDRETVTIANEIIKLNEKAQAVEDEIAMYGMGKEAIESMAIARLEEKRAVLLQFEGSEERVSQLEQEIDARKRLARAIDSKETLEANAKAARKLSDEWKRDFDRIEDWIGDAIGRGVTKGKDIWKSLIDGLKASFARLVLSPIISPIAAFGASFLNPGAAQAAGTAASSIGSATSMLSAGKAIWDGFSTGFASNIGGLAQQLGVATNNAWLVNVGSGMKGAVGSAPGVGVGNALGTATGYAAGIAGGIYGGRLISGGYSVSGSGNGLVNAGTAAGGAIGALGFAAGPLGALIGGLAAGAVNRLFGRKLADSGVEGSIVGDQFTGKSYEYYKGGVFRSSKTKTSELDKETGDVFQSAISGMYDTFSGLSQAIGAGSDTLKDFTYNFKMSLKGFSEEDVQKAIVANLKAADDRMAIALVDKITSGVVKSDLTPYLDDISRIVLAKRDELDDDHMNVGKVSEFIQQILALGDVLSDNAGFAKQFGEALDFDKLEAAGKKGEGVVDTFARLNSVFSVTNDLALTLGRDMASAFGSVGLASTAAREGLIAAAGGLEALASQTAFYAQNFLSSTQQEELARKQLRAALDPVGLGDIDTKDEYTAKVGELFGKTDAESQKLLATLLKLGPAIKTVSDYGAAAAEEIAQAAAQAAATEMDQRIALFRLSGDESTAVALERERELAAMSEGERALQRMIYARQDEASAAERAMQSVNDAFSGLQRSVEAERNSVTAAYQSVMESLGKQIDTVSGSVSKLSSLSSSLRSTLNSMRLDSQLGTDRAAASAQIQAALLMAKTGGVLPDAESLQQALSVVSQPNEQLYASFVDFQRNYLKDKNAIAELAGITDVAKSVQENILDSLNDQRDAAEQAYEDEMQRLDGILTKAQEQLDVLNGIKTGILSIPEALAGFAAAVQAATAARPVPAPAGGGGSSAPAGSAASFVEGLYGSLLGRESDADGLAAHLAAIQAGASFQQITENFLNSQEYLSKIPKLDVGTNYVQRSGLAIIHEGEAVVPKAYNPAANVNALRAASDNSEVAAEIRAMRAENEQLRKDLNHVLGRVAESAEKTADLIDNVTEGGNAMRSEVMA